jgi:hypothetical protein
VSYASRDHRQLDAAHAEALARDGDEQVDGGPTVRSRDRGRDARSLGSSGGGRVLLTTLSIRTSAKGRSYLSGYLGKASVVAFEGEPDKFGNETWDVFLSEPRPREGGQP